MTSSHRLPGTAAGRALTPPSAVDATPAGGRHRRPLGRGVGAVARGVALAGALALAGCQGLAPPSRGEPASAAVARFGPPTAEHALADGARRLEFARGPFVRETWMVDVDAAGRIVAVEQVLHERRFAAVREGWSPDEVRRWLGAPHRVQPEFAGKTSWYWRYPTFDCLVAATTFGPQRTVVGGVALMDDPWCAVDDR